MMHAEPDHALGGTVRGLREDRDLTREALAFEAGITTATLARIESGHASPQWATLRAIARTLELRTDQLVDQVEAARAAEESAEPITEVWA
jgi:transcriptional regulator with XRE-family HTH domain